MKKIVDKLKKIANIIGKQNAILVVFILFVVVVSGLYKTFSIYTATDGVSFIEGIKTYKFVLQSNDNAYSVTVGANSSKYLAITVTNDEALSLLYGVYYSYTDDLSTLNIGYLSDSEYLPKGTIDANSERVIKLSIDNLSSSDITITFGVKYGFINGGALVLDSYQYWFDKKITLLGSVDPGSWVSYVGDNGCSGKLCNGVNENFSSSSAFGYCANSDYQFTVNGWRVAYTKDSIPYLISAGSPECMCTSSDGTMPASCSSASISSTHILNLNNTSLGYCNSKYAYDNSCNSSSAWNFGLTDFNNIMNNTNTFTTCYQVSNTGCGKNNDLIDVGGMYWTATSSENLLANSVFLWGPPEAAWGVAYSHNNHGVRPVLKLDSDVRVVSGSGTYADPYRIASDSTLVEDLSGNENHAVDYGNIWDKTAGTITTNNSYSRVDAGLRNYKFGDSVTMAIRVKFNSINADVTNDIFGNWESGGFGFELRNSGGYLQFPLYISGGYKYFVSTLVPELDTWYTIVGTYDGTNISVYVNGTKQTLNTSISTAVSTASGDIGVSSQPFYIGSNPGPSLTVNAPADITVDSALIFERALTASEISENYSGVINPVNKADLLLYYDFERTIEEEVAMSVTDGVTTYYTSLSEAVAAASTTTTTTITLLENTTETINITTALNDTIIDLNGRQLTGNIINTNTNSNITIKNGTIVKSGTSSSIEPMSTIVNYGTLTIENGTYVNHTPRGYCINNKSGITTIKDGTFKITYEGSDGSTIYSDTGSTLAITGGTIDSVAYGLVNNGATVQVTDMTITVSASDREGLLTRANGITNIYTSTITAYSAVMNFSNEGTIVAHESDLLGIVSGIVYELGWKSSTVAEWHVYGQSDAACAVWTSNNGQDDLIWTTASSYTGTYNTYLYCQVDKAEHNNESGEYLTDIYNAAQTTYYYGASFTMP